MARERLGAGRGHDALEQEAPHGLQREGAAGFEALGDAEREAASCHVVGGDEGNAGLGAGPDARGQGGPRVTRAALSSARCLSRAVASVGDAC